MPTVSWSLSIPWEEILLLEKKIDERTKLGNRKTELSLELGGSVRSLSWSERMPPMVDRVTEMVENGGARVEALRPEPAVTYAGVARFPLRLTTSCDLSELTGIMFAVEKAEPRLEVERLYIRVPREADTPQNRFTVEMTITSFALKEKSTADKKAAPTGSGKPAAGQSAVGKGGAR